MSSILGQFGNKGVPLGRIAGIPITLDWTWFPIAILFVVSVTTSYEPVLGTLGAILVGLAMTSGFFGSILAHEFGHALTARRFGIGTESIALHLFGGVAKITSEPRTPRQELLVAVAGPAVSLGLASLFGLLTLTIPNTVGTPLSLLAMESVFYSLGLSNLILGLFNLIPGFPLDGGRILRALTRQHAQDVRRTVQARNQEDEDQKQSHDGQQAAQRQAFENQEQTLGELPSNPVPALFRTRPLVADGL